CGRGRRAVRAAADFSCAGFPGAGRLGAGDTVVGELTEAARQAADDPAGHDATTDRSAALAADGPSVCPPSTL
ncbi:MAG TPA: hypothetical protein VNW50_12610, partial [Streptosporangiaceae bacterium]|nr:hypothetical protein [Streptosporangiaceae bacterium]